MQEFPFTMYGIHLVIHETLSFRKLFRFVNEIHHYCTVTLNPIVHFCRNYIFSVNAFLFVLCTLRGRMSCLLRALTSASAAMRDFSFSSSCIITRDSRSEVTSDNREYKAYCRRGIKTEEKAKVVAVGCGTELILFLTALAIFFTKMI